MKTRCLCAAIAVALLGYLPVRAAEDTFQMEAITLSNSTAADAALQAFRWSARPSRRPVQSTYRFLP